MKSSTEKTVQLEAYCISSGMFVCSLIGLVEYANIGFADRLRANEEIQRMYDAVYGDTELSYVRGFTATQDRETGFWSHLLRKYGKHSSVHKIALRLHALMPTIAVSIQLLILL